MSKVIAVKEEQLNVLRANYNNSAPVLNGPQNNADLLSGTLGEQVQEIPMQVNMEEQPVNLNSNLFQPSESVNSSNQFLNSMPQDNSGELVSNNVMVDSNIGKNTDLQVPFNEPIMENTVEVGNDVEIKQMIKEEIKKRVVTKVESIIDEVVEEVYGEIQKKNSGANLIENTSSMEISMGQELSAGSQSVDNNANAFEPNPVDLDQTMYINGNDWANQMAEVQNGMTKAA